MALLSAVEAVDVKEAEEVGALPWPGRDFLPLNLLIIFDAVYSRPMLLPPDEEGAEYECEVEGAISPPPEAAPMIPTAAAGVGDVSSSSSSSSSSRDGQAERLLEHAELVGLQAALRAQQLHLRTQRLHLLDQQLLLEEQDVTVHRIYKGGSGSSEKGGKFSTNYGGPHQQQRVNMHANTVTSRNGTKVPTVRIAAERTFCVLNVESSFSYLSL